MSAHKRNRLQERWTAEGKVDDLVRLAHITAAGQDHSWVHNLHGSRHAALPPSEWITAARIRQGCPLTHTTIPMTCAACGCQHLDTAGRHATCCAKGESTRGHNDIWDTLLECLREVDATAEKEVPGLVPSDPGLRPADVLTRATTRVGEMAIDVMVRSPYAQDAGDNPQLEGVQRKVKRYSEVQGELQGLGIVYTPFVWSCYGAPDAAVTQALTHAASKAHSTSRAGSPKAALARWRCRLAVAIWKRNARMAQSCVRPLADPELFVQHTRDCAVDACEDPKYGPCNED